MAASRARSAKRRGGCVLHDRRLRRGHRQLHAHAERRGLRRRPVLQRGRGLRPGEWLPAGHAPQSGGEGVSCTIDACDEATDSCTHTPNDGACDDGLYCNGAETCDPVNGCQPGTAPNCDDGVSCTIDACDEATDSCTHTPNDGACDDGLYCNGAETCDPVNGCQPGTAPNCDDGVSCTIDACDEATDSCTHTPNDGACDDGNPCTDDACVAQSGCVSTADDTNTCDDGNACTTVDLCQGGACTGTSPVVCTASDACHVGTCDPGTGACTDSPAPDGTACDDGDATTCTDVCTSGTCSGTVVPEPPEVGNSVQLEKRAGTQVVISWSGPTAGARYNVYRGTGGPPAPWAYDQSCQAQGLSRQSFS